ncbi:hypothetical protein VTN77DRAFT_9769 [Rasamsonia byssochlamydoides]|uniref:uncharacterized protein n=1 Tax=Rasamsonia byssochlamydoides TaxID=89139 RepID=UPI003742B428
MPPTPSHPTLIQVIHGSKPFSSSAVSLVDLPAGAVLTRLDTHATPAPQPKYTTLQTGRNTHIELNSDLVYCNHSCRPSVVFDTRRMEVRVVDDRPLRKGDAITFFYPSTEWEMDQPFECGCQAGEGVCKGLISGAKTMSREQLEGYWLNEHIVELLEERDNMKQTS